MKSEKEKMLAGEPYFSRDPELLAMYKSARELLAVFNSRPEANPHEKTAVLRQLLGSAGEGIWIESPFYCDLGKNIHLGDGVFINVNCVFVDNNLINIGSNTLIGPATQIYTATHPIKAADRIQHDRTGEVYYVTSTAQVTIGENCWIGGNVTILPGVTIGDNTTVGAGSLVNRDVPSDAVAAGNPFKIIRKIES